jgi:multimeric flavodoxin WrbA
MQVVREADAIILGAPGRQGGMCGEMRLFLDALAPLQVERSLASKASSPGALKVRHSAPLLSLLSHQPQRAGWR